MKTYALKLVLVLSIFIASSAHSENKSELVGAVAGEMELSEGETEARVDSLLKAITEALIKENRVAITGFGAFSIGSRGARTGKNPQTGATIQILASKSVRFKAGKALKDAVQ